MNILFIGHSHHTLTMSSRFFVDLISRSHDVECKFVEPEAPLGGELLDAAGAKDLVILWQLDYLAPIFLAMGKKTVVIPMFDGSSSMPDLHWIWSSGASFINFSMILSRRLEGLGLNSLLLKYFKEPAPKEDLADFSDGLKVFIWHRRPEHGINLQLIERMLQGPIREIHVHDAPDVAAGRNPVYLQRHRHDYNLKVSRWFEDSAQYHQALSSANVFIAPRASEGIGMTMLEAMARGMLVICSAQATHNEYIDHGVNGLLFDVHNPHPLDLSHARELGQMAWRTVAEGYADWSKAESEIGVFLNAVPESTSLEVPDLKQFGSSLSRAYYSGKHGYAQYLLNNVDLIAQMSARKIFGRIDNNANLRELRPARSSMSLLDQEGMPVPARLRERTLLSPEIASFTRPGAMITHSDSTWIKGHRATISFRIDPLVDHISAVKLRLRPAVGEAGQYVVISLNGHTLGLIDLPGAAADAEFPIPARLVARDNHIHFQAGTVVYDEALECEISIGIDAIAFS